jgi:N-acetylglucosaminyldiphosphoundecaprenol N-acetyl-beta-D-mannosaminyltransferase
MDVDRDNTERPEVPASTDAVPSVPRVSLLGTMVSASTFAAAQDFLEALVDRGVGGYICHANAFSVTMAHDDPRYRELLNRSSYLAADGMSAVWAVRCLGAPADRVHGDDFFLACCERFVGWRHFFVGGRTGQPEAAAEETRRRFPGISIVGTHATPTRPVSAAETEAILEDIRSTRASVVWVGMGTPLQDEWMAANALRAGVPMVGVGSLFDLLTGRTRAAPDWMKRLGLQWLFRLQQEPRRLAFRYLYYNPRFVLAFAGQLARRAFGRALAPDDLLP